MDLVEHWFARREFVQYNMKYNGMTKMEAERYWIRCLNCDDIYRRTYLHEVQLRLHAWLD